MTGPRLPFSEELHAQKYRGEGETFRELTNRVATALQDDDAHYKAFRDVLLEMRFMPAGRVQAAMGSTKAVTPYNCYVSGTIADSFADDPGSIMDRAKEAAQTMRMGGGIGYDFSPLRPRGDLIKKLKSLSSGPVSFMDIYDAVCRCTSSAGNRRGAQMGVLRVDHPDIEEFIHVKQNQTRLTGFNVSVAVTDEFMGAAMAGKPFKLRFDGRVYREIDAAALWDTIMRSTWDWAEPGVLFIDQINRKNNLWYCETIAATNPCGEQPLPPHGACLLGSFNLTKYLFGTPGNYLFNWHQFQVDIPVVVAAMDNIIDRAIYPLPAQELEAKMKRRMGLGVAGLANCIEALGAPYGTPMFIAYEQGLLRFLNQECYRASARRAAVKGPFPLFDPANYLAGEFIRSLDDETQKLISVYGIRNSHLTSIAPTGTISLCADNISSGVEPVYQHFFQRRVVMREGARVELVEDYGYRELGVEGRTADAVTLDQAGLRHGSSEAAREYVKRVGERVVKVQEHLDVLIEAQRHVDSAVSKTCNVAADISWTEFKSVYEQAWQRGAKGCTTYRSAGMRAGIFNPPEGASCKIDPETGRRECE